MQTFLHYLYGLDSCIHTQEAGGWMSLVKAGIHYNYKDNEPKLVLHYRTHEDEGAPCVTKLDYTTHDSLHIDSDPEEVGSHHATCHMT